MPKRVGLVWYDEEWKRIFGGRGDEAGSGRVLVLRRGGWDVLVGEKKQRDEGGEFRLLDGHLNNFVCKSNFGN